MSILPAAQFRHLTRWVRNGRRPDDRCCFRNCTATVPRPVRQDPDGLDERIALHHACWQLADRPSTFQSLEPLQPLMSLKKYQQQLFEFSELIDDGLGWMLTDPQTSTPDGIRSRQRILDLLHLA